MAENWIEDIKRRREAAAAEEEERARQAKAHAAVNADVEATARAWWDDMRRQLKATVEEIDTDKLFSVSIEPGGDLGFMASRTKFPAAAVTCTFDPRRNVLRAAYYFSRGHEDPGAVEEILATVTISNGNVEIRQDDRFLVDNLPKLLLEPLFEPRR